MTRGRAETDTRQRYVAAVAGLVRANPETT
jgi:hypothetical protein